jgi:integrase
MVNTHTPPSTSFATVGSTSVARQKVRRKFGFTKKLLDKLALPTNNQRAYFYDAQTRGLALAVSPAGKKVFVLYRKVAGRPERITIGPYPDLTIEQARGKAAELNGAIARGENPASKRRLVRDEATLAELFSTYLEHHAKPHKKTWSDDQGMFDKHFGVWKFRKLSDIRRADVLTLHARIGGKSGQYAANRVVELLSSMFGKAIEWGWNGENPATKIKAFKERKRERFLQPEELPAFFEALKAELNETVRDYILLSLLTGARRSNVQAMRWHEINFPSATWAIPETKNGESITLPLSATALNILESRKSKSKCNWVFPGDGTTGHLVEPKSAWKRILQRAASIQKKHWLEAHRGKDEADFAKECPSAGFHDLRVHDLRRTLGSWQAATGASLPIIGKSLGHKSLSATQIYARLNIDPVRSAVDKATDAMLLAANGSAKLLGDGNER